MTWKGWVIVLFGLAVGVAIACTPFGAVSPTDDPAEGGASSSGSSGASSGGLDASAVGDGGSSGSSGGDCDAKLCTRFDPPGPTTLPFGWSSYGSTVGSASRFAVTAITPRSAPNRLRLVTEVSKGTDEALYLQQDIGVIASEVVVRFALRIDERTADDKSVRLVELACDGTTFAKLKVTPDGTVQIDDSSNSTSVGALSTLGTWTRFDFRVTVNPMGSAAVLLENNPATSPIPVPPCIDAPVRLRLGNIIDDSTGTAGLYDLSFDDILVNWQ